MKDISTIAKTVEVTDYQRRSINISMDDVKLILSKINKYELTRLERVYIENISRSNGRGCVVVPVSIGYDDRLCNFRFILVDSGREITVVRMKGLPDLIAYSLMALDIKGSIENIDKELANKEIACVHEYTDSGERYFSKRNEIIAKKSLYADEEDGYKYITDIYRKLKFKCGESYKEPVEFSVLQSSVTIARYYESEMSKKNVGSKIVSVGRDWIAIEHDENEKYVDEIIKTTERLYIKAFGRRFEIPIEIEGWV